MILIIFFLKLSIYILTKPLNRRNAYDIKILMKATEDIAFFRDLVDKNG